MLEPHGGDPTDPAMVEDLERTLKALANANRIHLLIALQEPRRLGDIDLAPSRKDSRGHEDRAISKQAVRNHIDALVDLGVVETRGKPPGELKFVVNHARLYEVTERLRELATVKATVPVQEQTMARDPTGAAAAASGPHLVLVRGVREGQVFPLGPEPEGGWLIGRRRDAAISLDFDPYVSSAHCRIVRREGRHFLADLLENRNGTLLNWQPMVRGGIAPLRAGDLIGVGMSMLLYRE